jgi:hypothetical protein
MQSVPQQQGAQHGQCELYLTYRGLLRCLFTSRKPVARTFVSWADEVLFAAHLGTEEQREKLAAALVGVDVDIVRQFARHVLSFKMAGVYLLLLGTVGNLRTALRLSDDLPEDMLVLKWGRTQDADDRLEKHSKEYGSLKGAKLQLIYFTPIDPRYQSKAEVDAKKAVIEMGIHLEDVKIRGRKKTELVAMTAETLRTAAKPLFQCIAARYAGCLKEMAEELNLVRAVGEQKDERLKDKEEQVCELKQEKQELRQEKLELKEELKQEKQDKQELKEELKQEKQEKQELKARVAALQQENGQLQQEKEELKQEIQKLRGLLKQAQRH